MIVIDYSNHQPATCKLLEQRAESVCVCVCMCVCVCVCVLQCTYLLESYAHVLNMDEKNVWSLSSDYIKHIFKDYFKLVSGNLIIP